MPKPGTHEATKPRLWDYNFARAGTGSAWLNNETLAPNSVLCLKVELGAQGPVGKKTRRRSRHSTEGSALEAGVGTDSSEAKKGAPPTACGAREGLQKTVTASGEKATLGNRTVLQGPRARRVLSEIISLGES